MLQGPPFCRSFHPIGSTDVPRSTRRVPPVIHFCWISPWKSMAAMGVAPWPWLGPTPAGDCQVPFFKLSATSSRVFPRQLVMPMPVTSVVAYGIWGFPWPSRYPHSWMVCFMENSNQKWMITRGTPISGNLHMFRRVVSCLTYFEILYMLYTFLRLLCR